MIRRIRKSRVSKYIAAFLALSMITDLINPIGAFALTGGPSQPEVQSFEPVGTNQMVDPFTGDFTYNIPLLDVGGYPINISYHAGISPEDEASWVGLGWNINVGTINRNLRGLPDDFNGEYIQKEVHSKNMVNAGASLGLGAELFGVDKGNASVSLGISYNNYKGVGVELGAGISPAIPLSQKAGSILNLNLGFSISNEDLSISPSVSFATRTNKANKSYIGVGVGINYNSRAGLQDLSYGVVSKVNRKGYNGLGNSGIKDRKINGIKNSSTSFSSLSFNTPISSPNYTTPFASSSFSFSFKPGGTFFACDATMNVRGYFNDQWDKDNNYSVPGYGYFYSGAGDESEDAQLDFSREKDGIYMVKKPNLPLSSMSFDVFSVTGQGAGGVFRPYTNSVGTVFDPKVQNISVGGSFGGELGAGNLVHAGLDVKVVYTSSHSGKWSKHNNIAGNAVFLGENESPWVGYESAFFKQVGEMNVDAEPGFFQGLGGRDPVLVKLKEYGWDTYAESKLSTSASSSGFSVDNSDFVRTERQKRNQSFVPLNAELASHFGLEKSINFYQYSFNSGNPIYTPSTLERVSGLRKKDHISEITNYTPEGMRYVYGIPAYNKTQRDATFSVDAGDLYGSGTGLVSYDSGDDDTKDNRKGLDHFCSATTLPGYAHSFLLTAILSPDYVDYDGIEGPSSGDVGNYTKFSYVKVDSYKWQIPVSPDEGVTKVANHNEGLKSYSDDDKGSIVSGEKELWYLHQIETRTHVAVFYLSPRLDAQSSDGLVSQLKLDEIKLFAKNDFELNGEDAYVIKSVHFTYDYSLCPETPNSKEDVSLNPNKGKLTLKEISFSYGKSKYQHNKYTFTYPVNPSYSYNSSDRWGGYKPNSSTHPNNEYPYAEQNKSLADEYASAWNLGTINLPSGGTISVEYEADDYAFVMNKRAMQMIEIVDILNELPTSTYSAPSGDLPLFNDETPTDPNLYFVVEKNGSTIENLLKDQNGNLIKDLFFKGMVNVGMNKSLFEWVHTYMSIEAYGNIDDNYAYIKVHSADLGDNSGSLYVNPVAKATCQFIRIYLGDMLSGYNHNPNANADEVIGVFRAMANKIGDLFNGANRSLLNQQRAMWTKDGAAFLRLYSPEWTKIGGGHRVKSVVVSDNWEDMTLSDGESMNYGQVYSYRKFNDHAFGPSTISSGVASFEPVIGNEENPWREPVNYKNDKKWVADDEYFVEKPVGESVFPGASVGYSHVIVKNLERKNIENDPDRNVTRHAAGYSLFEFYTAYDFPVRTQQTMIQNIRKSNAPVAGLFGKLLLRDFTNVSQGYTVEIYNMHGRPKSQKEFSETGDLISGTEYFYKTQKDYPNRLDNNVLTVDKSGNISEKEIGVDMDMNIDSRESVSWALSGGVNSNLATFLIAIFPAMVPTILPSVSYQKTKFRSLVATKVINCYPVVDSIVAYQNGSRITTANELYDAETGQVLVTRTRNEFKDNIYNVTYPAHWAYDLMGPVYNNILFNAGDKTINNGVFSVSTTEENYFSRGDEIGCKLNGNFEKLWVVEVSTGTVKCIDNLGNVVSGSATDMVVVRSGKRNMQVLPVSQIVCRKSPINGTTFYVSNANEIIDASSTEFKDRWKAAGQVSCEDGPYSCTDCGYSTQGFVDFMNELINNNAVLESNFTLSSLNGCTFLGSGYNCEGSTYSATESTGLDGYVHLQMSLSSCNGTQYQINPLIHCSKESFSWSDVIGFTAYGNQVIYQYYDEYSQVQSCTTSVIGDFKPYLCEENENGNACGFTEGDQVNPYRVGILGAWRPFKTYKFLVNRDNALTETDVRVDGVYSEFVPFWTSNSGNDWNKSSDIRWVCAAEATKYNLAGEEAETRDALMHYSAAIYGYNNKLPIAVGVNAMMKEIGFDGFEDIGRGYCSLLHFNFPGAMLLRTKEESHTGHYSLKLGQGNVTQTYMTRCLTDSLPTEQLIESFPYSLTEADLQGVFGPHSNKANAQKFIISMWVKKNNNSYESDYSDVGISCSGATLSVQSRSKIIDGWQQVNYLLTIPSQSSGTLTLSLFNNSSVGAYFDDIRIFPADANMKSFVYDYETMRLMAELDNNNFATFYEYNDEGQLIRIKKETERGIVTLKQSINHLKN